jgi:hypothetical protein
MLHSNSLSYMHVLSVMWHYVFGYNSTIIGFDDTRRPTTQYHVLTLVLFQ